MGLTGDGAFLHRIEATLFLIEDALFKLDALSEAARRRVTQRQATGRLLKMGSIPFTALASFVGARTRKLLDWNSSVPHATKALFIGPW